MSTTPDPDIKLVTVLSTGDVGLMAIAKSMLDSANIDYSVRGEALRNVMGWSGSLNSALGEAELQVREDDAPNASRLLTQLLARDG
jgi:hypothetical protein